MKNVLSKSEGIELNLGGGVNEEEEGENKDYEVIVAGGRLRREQRKREEIKIIKNIIKREEIIRGY
jgi:3-keto-L-gulonate-6-phosphate decarboxylase